MYRKQNSKYDLYFAVRKHITELELNADCIELTPSEGSSNANVMGMAEDLDVIMLPKEVKKKKYKKHT